MTTEQCGVEVLKEAVWAWVEELDDDTPPCRWVRRFKVEREVVGTIWLRGDEVGWTVTADGDERESEVYDTLYREPGAIWTIDEQIEEMVNYIELYKWSKWEN